MALSSLYVYIVRYAYSVVKGFGKVISGELSSSGWTSAEREAAEARIIDIRHYREAALSQKVQRDVEEAIAHAEMER